MNQIIIDSNIDGTMMLYAHSLMTSKFFYISDDFYKIPGDENLKNG